MSEYVGTNGVLLRLQDYEHNNIPVGSQRGRVRVFSWCHV